MRNNKLPTDLDSFIRKWDIENEQLLKNIKHLYSLKLSLY